MSLSTLNAFVTSGYPRLATWWGWLPLPRRDFHPQDQCVFSWRTDISEYDVNEAALTNAYLEGVLQHLLSLAGRSPDALAAMRRHFGLWKSYLKSCMSAIEDFAISVQNFLPCLFSYFVSGTAVLSQSEVLGSYGISHPQHNLKCCIAARYSGSSVRLHLSLQYMQISSYTSTSKQLL